LAFIFLYTLRFGALVFRIDHNPTNASEDSTKKAQKRHSIHVIDANINVKIAISQIAESLMNFSSYHTPTADKNLRRYHAHPKLVFSLAVMAANSS
jgi:hypothetical protein